MFKDNKTPNKNKLGEVLGKTVSKLECVWRGQREIIISVTSDGATGEDWIVHHESKGISIGCRVEIILRSPSFKPTDGVTTKIVILKRNFLGNRDPNTKRVDDEAERRHYSRPSVEHACLLREKLTDEDIEAMNLRCIVVMHEPIKGLDGHLRLLGASCFDNGHKLIVLPGNPGVIWPPIYGFAYICS